MMSGEGAFVCQLPGILQRNHGCIRAVYLFKQAIETERKREKGRDLPNGNSLPKMPVKATSGPGESQGPQTVVGLPLAAGLKQ